MNNSCMTPPAPCRACEEYYEYLDGLCWQCWHDLAEAHSDDQEENAMTKFGEGLVGSDRLPQKYVNHSPRPDLPFEEGPPSTWPYMAESALWVGLMALGLWGMAGLWK